MSSHGFTKRLLMIALALVGAGPLLKRPRRSKLWRVARKMLSCSGGRARPSCRRAAV